MSGIKTCELCGTEFQCGSPFGCWCDHEEISARKRELLSFVASDCVCPDCLKKS